jgi:hypothetical protein
MNDRIPTFLVPACLGLLLVTACASTAPPDDREATGANQLTVEGAPVQPDKPGPAPGGDPTPSAGPAKPPPGPAPDCFMDVVGDGTCQSDAALRLAAEGECQLKRHTLSSFDAANDCTGGSTVAKFTCCR